MVSNNKEVISVAVISYNSALTAIETLDSIRFQSYGAENIELIISDDASVDNTVFIIEDWLRNYKNSFKCVKFLKNTENCGVAKNCNSAWKNATSKWVKTIAADDILFENCLLDNYEYAIKNNNAKIVFSIMKLFTIDNDGNKIFGKSSPDKYALMFFKMTQSEQFSFLQRQSIHGAPSSFIHRSLLEEVGFADERFPLMEDYPLWFKITKQGYKIHFLNKETVYYRISDSISNSVTRLINEKFVVEMYSINKLLIFPSLSWFRIITKFRIISWPLMMLLVSKVFKNKRNKISVCFLYAALIFRPGCLQDIKRKFKC